MRVFLWGFMGSGKSRVGRQLAGRLGMPFVDLDDDIVARAGRSIPEIFAAEGEEVVRDLEARSLAAVDRWPEAVIATGGGTPTRAANRRTMRELGTSVWLDVPFDVVLERLGPEARDARPLFRDEQAAHALYDARREFYDRSDVRIVVQGDDTIEAVVDRILDCLRDLMERDPLVRDPLVRDPLVRDPL